MSPVVERASVPFGWSALGSSSYFIGADTGLRIGSMGFTTATIKSTQERASGTGVLMQSIRADEYLGRRVRLTGFLKTQASDADASLWMRVDGRTDVLASDFMETRPVRGLTDWTQYTVVLDVPRNAVGISFGFALVGNGQAWLDDLALDVVGREIETTGHLGGVGSALLRSAKDGRYRSAAEMYASAPRWPINMNFEERAIAMK